MQPGARIQAAIEVIAAVEQSWGEGGAAADRIVQDYFRSRRYAGSKDRRAVTDMVYGVLRDRGMLQWRLGGSEQATPRLQVLTSLPSLADPALFEGAHAPEPLDSEEQAILDGATAREPNAAPDWARFNVPEWIMPKLAARFGDSLEVEMAGLSGRAPLDLRVNTLRGTMAEACVAIPEAEPCRWSPLGLRLAEPRPLAEHPAYRSGLIEIQDEGSQVAALLCGVGHGMQVADLCAGGGGKTLALAAVMENSGQIYAYDIDQNRLRALRGRSKKCNARNIQYFNQLKEYPRNLDRVILDVPCSGSGTWRRSPDLRWRPTPAWLDRVTGTQAALLDRGADLVGPSGQLIYITCSVLRDEGEDQITSFLERNPAFRLVPYTQNWPGEGPSPPPTLSDLSECLLMTPASHGTDGFFVAVLEAAQ